LIANSVERLIANWAQSSTVVSQGLGVGMAAGAAGVGAAGEATQGAAGGTQLSRSGGRERWPGRPISRQGTGQDVGMYPLRGRHSPPQTSSLLSLDSELIHGCNQFRD
jgi:hypothetical protein